MRKFKDSWISASEAYKWGRDDPGEKASYPFEWHMTCYCECAPDRSDRTARRNQSTDRLGWHCPGRDMWFEALDLEEKAETVKWGRKTKKWEKRRDLIKRIVCTCFHPWLKWAQKAAALSCLPRIMSHGSFIVFNLLLLRQMEIGVTQIPEGRPELTFLQQ